MQISPRGKSIGSNILAFLAGALLTLAFAPYDIFPLGILMPAFLLFLLLPLTPKRAFRRGYCFGLGFFGFGVYWVYISIHNYGDVPVPLAVAFTAGFIALLACFPASVAYLLNRYFPNTNQSKILCAFPALWVVSEWIRSWIFTGFPWLFLGYSQMNSPLKGYAPIMSVYGVSLAALVSGSLLLYALRQFRKKNNLSAYLHLLTCLSLWLGGEMLTLVQWTQAAGKPIHVSLVQGSIPQAIKWSPEYLQLSLERYQKLSQPLWQKNHLIIWPEAAVPLSLTEAAPFINYLAAQARAQQTDLILGIPAPASMTEDEYYNSVIVIGKDQDKYLKRHLVPFGEYMPYPQLFARLFSFLHIPMSNLVPGLWMQKPLSVLGQKVLASICYEIAYPELILSRDSSINFMLTLTNDAWFDRSNAQAQHLQMAQMRALEMGRPLLFVGNDGITAIIEQDGRIESAAPPYQPYVLTGSIQPVTGITPWQEFAMTPVLFTLIILIFAALRGRHTLESK